MKMALIVVLGLATSLCVRGASTLTVKTYQEGIASGDKEVAMATKIYVGALGDGFMWANTFTKGPFFCPPPKFIFDVDSYINIIDAQIKERSATRSKEDLNGTFIAILLGYGLQSKFPCSSAVPLPVK